MQIFLISFRQLSCNFFTNLLTAVLRVRVVRVLGNINNEKILGANILILSFLLLVNSIIFEDQSLYKESHDYF